MRVVWFDVARPQVPQTGFRSGEASLAVLAVEGHEDGGDGVVSISPNTVHALLGHGVIDALNRLAPQPGPIGSKRDALLSPAAAPKAADILYDADRRTYGARWAAVEFRASVIDGVEYRIRIDNRQYQRELSRLQYLASRAAYYGHGLRFRI